MGMRLSKPAGTHLPRRMREGGTVVTPVYEPGPIRCGVNAVCEVLWCMIRAVFFFWP